MPISPTDVGRFAIPVLIGTGGAFGASMAIRLAQSINGPPHMTPNAILGITIFGAAIGASVGAANFTKRAADAAVSDNDRDRQQSQLKPSSAVHVPDWKSFLETTKSGPALSIEQPTPFRVWAVVCRITVLIALIIGIVLFCFGRELADGRTTLMDALMFTSPISGLVIALFVTMAGYGIAEQRREQALCVLAARLGFGYASRADGNLLMELQSAGLIPVGRVSHVLFAQAVSQNLVVFDHTYSYSCGKHQKMITQTVVAFRFAEPWLPAFAMRPQTFSDNLYLWDAPVDFNFASHQRFSADYLLAGVNEQAVRRLFKPQVLDHLEELTGLCIAGNGPMLVVYRPNECLSVDDIPNFLDVSFGVAAAFVKAAK